MRPLWQPANETQKSDVFCVCHGQVALLFATGLKSQKVRASSEQTAGPQLFCIKRLAFPNKEIARFLAAAPAGACDYVWDWRQISAETVEETVATHGCCWELTSCNNLAVVGVPGSYYAYLNDTTATGTAQLYIEYHKIEELDPRIAGLYFQ